MAEEINSPYWQVADSSQGCKRCADRRLPRPILRHRPNHRTALLVSPGQQRRSHSSDDPGEWKLPIAFAQPPSRIQAEAAASATFNPSGVFGFNRDGEYSDNSLNTTDISRGRSGHAVRFYPLRNASGVLFPNTWLMVMDYQNGQYDNFDFQDNAYVVTNMRPATTAPAVADLEAFGVNNGVGLQWAPVNDPNLIGYNVYSSSSPTGTFTKLNAAQSRQRASSMLPPSAARRLITTSRPSSLRANPRRLTHRPSRWERS